MAWSLAHPVRVGVASRGESRPPYVAGVITCLGSSTSSTHFLNPTPHLIRSPRDRLISVCTARPWQGPLRHGSDIWNNSLESELLCLMYLAGKTFRRKKVMHRRLVLTGGLVATALTAILLTASIASAASGNVGFGFNARSISGFPTGSATLTGGGSYN